MGKEGWRKGGWTQLSLKTANAIVKHIRWLCCTFAPPASPDSCSPCSRYAVCKYEPIAQFVSQPICPHWYMSAKSSSQVPSMPEVSFHDAPSEYMRTYFRPATCR